MSSIGNTCNQYCNNSEILAKILHQIKNICIKCCEEIGKIAIILQEI